MNEAGLPRIEPESLGSAEYRRAHGVRYAYAAGSMYKAVASEDLVVRLGRAGLLGYFGAGGLKAERIASAVARFHRELDGGPFGVNLLASTENPAREMETVRLLLRLGVRRVEAASFVRPTEAVVFYRLSGARRLTDGSVHLPNRVLAKVSRPEVARAFLEPPPAPLVERLVAAGLLSRSEAEVAGEVRMVDELCAEADSGGHTDQRPLVTLVPDTLRLRDEAMCAWRSRAGAPPVLVGAAGGLGEPSAVAAAFVLGADFVVTGSVNQCTAEAGTSDAVKDMLQTVSVHDMAIVPAGDMLETGTRAQVVRRGLFYPARANRLYELYSRHGSLEELDESTLRMLTRKYFRRDLAEVWADTRRYYEGANPDLARLAEQDPKLRMLLVFKAYFVQSIRLAMRGDTDHQVDYQINCGPAMGALNSVLAGTPMEHWRNRHVDEIGELLMEGAARWLNDRWASCARLPAETTGRV